MTKRSTWALPYAVFLVLFVALPLILIMFYAFRDASGGFTFGNFTKFFTDKDAIETFALSLEVAIENTAICILLGYPAAWILANKKLNKSAVTIVLFIMPMWINALMRTLATTELFNMLGIQLGKGTLLAGMVYDYLPFMIYPIYNILEKMDKSYGEAASDLGATPWQVFWIADMREPEPCMSPVNRLLYSSVENPVQLPRTLLSVNEKTAMNTIGA